MVYDLFYVHRNSKSSSCYHLRNMATLIKSCSRIQYEIVKQASQSKGM